MRLSTVYEMKPHELIAVPAFEFHNIVDDCGVVEQFDEPIPHHTYAAGADFALGIPG